MTTLLDTGQALQPGAKKVYIVIHAHHISVYDRKDDYVKARNRARVNPMRRFTSVMDLANWCRVSGCTIVQETNLAIG